MKKVSKKVYVDVILNWFLHTFISNRNKGLSRGRSEYLQFIMHFKSFSFCLWLHLRCASLRRFYFVYCWNICLIAHGFSPYVHKRPHTNFSDFNLTLFLHMHLLWIISNSISFLPGSNCTVISFSIFFLIKIYSVFRN